ncbi:hypothetical protein D3C72_544700 [compost metagenome]
MRSYMCPALVTALVVSACAAPMAPRGAAGPAQAPAVPGAPARALENLRLQAVTAVAIQSASATSAARNMPASNLIDASATTVWQNAPRTQGATLTLRLGGTQAVPLSGLTITGAAFPAGANFDVRVSANGLTGYQTVLSNQTKPAAGSLTLSLPGSSARGVQIVLRSPATATFSIGGIGLTTGTPGAPGGGGNTGGSGPAPTATSHVFGTMLAMVPQNRARGRLRVEGQGSATDGATTSLNAVMVDAFDGTMDFKLKGRATMSAIIPGPREILNTTRSFMDGNTEFNLTALPDEAGVLVGENAALTQLVELIYPPATGLPPEPVVPGEVAFTQDVIVRCEVNGQANMPLALNSRVNVTFTLTKTDMQDRVLETWRGEMRNVLVDTQRP